MKPHFCFFLSLALLARFAAAANLDELNKKFAIYNGEMKFLAGEGGLPCIDIHCATCTGRIYLQGSQVTAWQPAGADPVLFMSPKCVFQDGQPMRGGVPICFPWYGALAGNPDAPTHGFARVMEWTVDSAGLTARGEVVIDMSLKNSDATKKYWDADFQIRHRVIFGSQLTMSLEVTNTGPAPMQFAEVLHNYFAVKDVNKVSVAGLDNTDYIDKADRRTRKHQSGPVTISGETDRLYVNTHNTCVITDALMNRKISVEKSGSQMTAVYNPGPIKAIGIFDLGPTGWPGMLCVETLNAEDAKITLKPGEISKMQSLISIEPIPKQP